MRRLTFAFTFTFTSTLTFTCLCVATTGGAYAERAETGDDGVMLLDAADPGAPARDLARLRKRLDALGVLHTTEPALEAALEGAAPLDLTRVRDAFADFDYDRADELLDGIIADTLETGDPARLAQPLAQVLHWKGMVADATDDPDGAATWFAASFRLDPEQQIDRDHTPPRVRAVIRRARQADRPDGTIAIEVDDDAETSDAARVAIDGGPATRIGGPVPVDAGVHLIVVTAPDRGPSAELVRVRAGREERVSVELPPEGRLERARRARDAAIQARSGKRRLERVRPLAKITGARKLLVVEGDGDDLTVRVYDLSARTISEPLALADATRPAVLANLLGVDDGVRARPPRWYARWYVWAGVAAVAGGGYLAWDLTHRDPTSVRGF